MSDDIPFLTNDASLRTEVGIILSDWEQEEITKKEAILAILTLCDDACEVMGLR